jgi:polyhydroxyalkanoate synthesis regulator protein
MAPLCRTSPARRRSVLAQIIFEQENKAGQNLLPTTFLRQLIRFYGDSMGRVAEARPDRAFVQTLIDLARRLNIETVAEWVQDEESARLLCDWGCDYVQGRLIDRRETGDGG